MGVEYEYSKLPKETTSHFSRDTTDILLWFSSPPVNIPGVSTYFSPSNKQPPYSLDYLHWRATKTKETKASQIKNQTEHNAMKAYAKGD
ncbi:hypothetical protein C8J55DRAFT_518337 [Lentinula edodes]|uniref:Uncharacterized protein n=1 Tax=Lentinula lateritia TaxID=40482 RepID=A0A9W9A5Y6_9AGAR|nr:hypothetical protein C8J55DRAFT_518337 [Lentinula edodes]